MVCCHFYGHHRTHSCRQCQGMLKHYYIVWPTGRLAAFAVSMPSYAFCFIYLPTAMLYKSLGSIECTKCELLQSMIPGVCQSMSYDLKRLRCAKTAVRIEVLSGVETLGDPRDIVLDVSHDFPHTFDAALAKLLWPLALICPLRDRLI